VDAVRVEGPEPVDACIGRGGRERTRVLRRLADDEHEPVAGADRHGLVPDGVAGRCQDAHAVGYLAIAVHRVVVRAGKIDPLADRVALVSRGIKLGLLYHDRHAGERPVLTAMVEVQVRVQDHPNSVGVEAGGGQSLAHLPPPGTVVLVDPGIAFADPGVDEHDAVGMPNGEPEDRAVIAGERVRCRIRHVGEVERDDVVGRHRVPFSLQNRSCERRPGIPYGGETLRSTDMASSRRGSGPSVWAALGIVYVVWGSTYLAIAIAVQTLPPLLYAGLRFLLAGLLLAGWLAFRGVDLRISRRELAGAAAVGILLLAAANGLVVLAERTVPSGVAALIVASIPLWIVVYRMVAGERVGRDLLAGVLLGLVGVAILVVPGGLTRTMDPIGSLMLFGATLSWALGTFLSPRLETPRNAFVSTTYQMLAGGVVLLVVALARGELANVDPSTFSVRSLIAFAYLVVFGSLVAYSAYTWLLQNASVSLVSTYAFVNPVVAVVLGALILAEPITASIVIGAAVIVVAVAFIVLRQNTQREARRGAVAAAAD